jgi:hypothetical protein
MTASERIRIARHYADGVKSAHRWLVTDMRPIGNSASSYAALSLARAKDNRTFAPARAYLLAMARTLRMNS